VVEAKYRSDGKMPKMDVLVDNTVQMSDPWIEKRIDDYFGIYDARLPASELEIRIGARDKFMTLWFTGTVQKEVLLTDRYGIATREVIP
jgi:hypothetical protein